MWGEIKSRMTAETMKPSEFSSTKMMLLLALLWHGVPDAEGVATCCTRQPRPCRLYELLCRAGIRNGTDAVRSPGRLTNDAAAGILTLGKRKLSDSRYQDRLQHLLNGSRNQAAGILTMGRRSEDGGTLSTPRSSVPVHIRGTSTGSGTIPAANKLELERPMKFLMQPVDRDTYRR